MKNTLLLAALVSTSAFAQETPPPPPDAPPVASEPAPITSESAPDPEPVSAGRIRWGVSGNLGWHFPQSAFTFGAEGRFGYQLSDMFGAYAIFGGTAGFGFGGSVSGNSASVSATALSRWYLGAIAELLLGDLFFVGAGPVFANGGLAGAVVSGNAGGVGSAVFAHGGPSFGLDVRLGLQLGRKAGPSQRKSGFSLGLSALTLLHPNTAVVRTEAGMNGGTVDVSTRELMVTVTPMLMLGYDWR